MKQLGRIYVLLIPYFLREVQVTISNVCSLKVTCFGWTMALGRYFVFWLQLRMYFLVNNQFRGHNLLKANIVFCELTLLLY